MTVSSFARMTGATSKEVQEAIKRGQLVIEKDGGIDINHDLSLNFIRTARAKKAGLAPLPDPDELDIETADLGSIDFDHPEKYLNAHGGANLVNRDKAAATLKRLVDIKRHQQAFKKEAGILIERELVKSHFSAFSAALQSNLLTLPKRTAPQVVARARSDGEKAVEAYLAEEISAAITRAIEELKL